MNERLIGAAHALMEDFTSVRRGEKGAEPKGQALNLRVDFCSYPSMVVIYGHELWVVPGRTRSRVQAAKLNFLYRLGFPLEIGEEALPSGKSSE